MAFVYILHSQCNGKYYVGSTILEPQTRLKQHLRHKYGKSKFTAKIKDWELFFWFECNSLNQAQLIENHIKRMKGKRYLRNLKLYPELHLKLLEKYNK